MARPSVAHGGFLIPNAGSVSDPILSEPDRVDFNTMAGGRWGVLTGLLAVGNGGTGITVAAGTAMVNGKFVVVRNQVTVTVSVPTGASKFDLIVVDDNGNVYINPGTEAADPVYPDPKINETIIAAVYCKSGATNVSDFVIDKRKLLAPALVTQIGPGEELVRNFKDIPAEPENPPQDYYTMRGDGSMTWLNDTTLMRYGIKTLEIGDHLRTKGNVTVGLDLSGRDVTASQNVTGLNLRRETTMPAVSTARKSDIWQDPDTGHAYIAHLELDGSGLFWDELVTFSNVLPPGMIVFSLESPTRMARAGWLAMNGTTQVYEQEHPNIFAVAALAPYIVAGTVAPERSMWLPDMRRRFPLVNFDDPGKYGPKNTAGQNRAANSIILTTDQLPSHRHDTQTQSGAGFTPLGVVKITGSKHSHTEANDTHDHDYVDPAHKHKVSLAYVEGVANTNQGRPGEGVVFAPDATGRSDSFVGSAYTGIKISNYTHSHDTKDGDHYHDLQMNPIGAHYHTMAGVTVGKGAAIDITPNYLTCYCYIKV